MQHFQPIPISLAHPQLLLVFHPASLPVLNRNFLLCHKRNFSLCCDTRKCRLAKWKRSGYRTAARAKLQGGKSNGTGRLGGRRSSEVTVAPAFREDKTLVSVDLECLSCHQRGRVDLTAEMFKELSASWKMLQNCGVCGEVTEWSFAEAPVEAEEQVDFWDWVATTE